MLALARERFFFGWWEIRLVFLLSSFYPSVFGCSLCALCRPFAKKWIRFFIKPFRFHLPHVSFVLADMQPRGCGVFHCLCTNFHWISTNSLFTSSTQTHPFSYLATTKWYLYQITLLAPPNRRRAKNCHIFALTIFSALLAKIIYRKYIACWTNYHINPFAQYQKQQQQ